MVPASSRPARTRADAGPGAARSRRWFAAAGVALLAIAGALTALVVRLDTRSAGVAVPVAVTRAGSVLMVSGRVWRVSGVNEYWLGLDDNVSDSGGATYPSHFAVDQGLQAAKDLGAGLVRATTLGVSVGCARCLEPSRGHFNDAAFAPIDYAVATARRDGLRLMIPLTDQWHYYHGGKHVFTSWFGHPDLPGQTVSTSSQQRATEAAFYTSRPVIASFHRYIHHLLTHRNPLTGQTLGHDPTIAIWETGNELWDAPPAWSEQTAHYIKTLAPHTLVADGTDSTGVDIRNTAVTAPDIDIEDAHLYPADTPTALHTATTQAAYTAAHHKAYLIGEYPLDGTPTGTRTFLHTTATNPHTSATLAWTLLPWLPNHTPEPHGETYTLHYPWSTPKEHAEDLLLQQQARAIAAQVSAGG